MAFHDRNKDGIMQQHTIITDFDTEDACKVHDDKVNKFNMEHIVFYNSALTLTTNNRAYLITSCLYADGIVKSESTSKFAKVTEMKDAVIQEKLPGSNVVINKFVKVPRNA